MVRPSQPNTPLLTPTMLTPINTSVINHNVAEIYLGAAVAAEREARAGLAAAAEQRAAAAERAAAASTAALCGELARDEAEAAAARV